MTRQDGADPQPQQGSGSGRRGNAPCRTSRPSSGSTGPWPPRIAAKDAFFEFLFSRAPVNYDELKRKAAAREPLPAFRLEGVKLTFNVDVGLRHRAHAAHAERGRDRRRLAIRSLKNTYVAFGAHYDHVGYAEGEVVDREGGPRRVRAAWPSSSRRAPSTIASGTAQTTTVRGRWV